MSDITELERRLTAALDRISKGVATLKSTPAQPEVDPEAEQHLAEAQSRATSLEETLETAQARIERLEARALRLTDRLEDAELENARLGQVIAALRAHTDALSDANLAGNDASDTINAGMASELADLRATRAADIAQMDEILAELAPALKEA